MKPRKAKSAIVMTFQAAQRRVISTNIPHNNASRFYLFLSLKYEAMLHILLYESSNGGSGTKINAKRKIKLVLGSGQRQYAV